MYPVRARFEAALVPFFKGQWDVARPLIEACLAQALYSHKYNINL